MSKFIKDNFILILSVLYLLSPIDFIPEALLGPLGLIDDLSLALFLLASSSWKYFQAQRASSQTAEQSTDSKE